VSQEQALRGVADALFKDDGPTRRLRDHAEPGLAERDVGAAGSLASGGARRARRGGAGVVGGVAVAGHAQAVARRRAGGVCGVFGGGAGGTGWSSQVCKSARREGAVRADKTIHSLWNTCELCIQTSRGQKEIFV